MAAPTSTVADTQTPTKTGWHLLTFVNGDTAVVRWDGTNWVWGSATPPTSSITSITWLGNTIADIFNNHLTNWNTTISALPAAVQAELSSEATSGYLLKGQPIVVNGSGQVVGGNPSLDNSEAQGEGTGPNETTGQQISSLTGAGEISAIWSAITNPSNWLRGLEIVGAFVAIYFALRELTGAPGVTQIAEKVRP